MESPTDAAPQLGGNTILPTKNRQQRFRNWVFTSFEPDNTEWLNNEHIRAYLYGIEVCPETKNIHLQGMIQLEKQNALSWVKNKLNNKCHWEPMRGTIEESIAYCSKDGNVTSKGTFKKERQRTDLKDIAEDILNNKFDCLTNIEHAEAIIKYSKGIEHLKNLKNNNEIKIELKKEFANFIPNEYQLIMIEHLENQNNRQITWVYDKVGNKGKSYFARYLLIMENATIFSNSKTQDIAYAYKNEPIVIFDFSRSQQEFINYGVIEDLKNGILFSAKYESTTKIFKKPKIIIMANFPPELNKLSMDRWDYIEI